MKLKLILTQLIYNQIMHMHKLYPTTEWSGPAFYKKVNKDKDGWTTSWQLLGFMPVDLGDTASTEFTGDKLMDELEIIYEYNPEFKDCYLGLIHSHHSLSSGAYFSGTDTEQLEDCANQTCYPSLVVAKYSTGSPFAFAVSWEDQFKVTHLTEAKDATIDIIGMSYKPDGYFKKCVANLKKQAKENKKTNSYGYYNGQTNMFGTYKLNSAQTIDYTYRNDYDPSIKDRKYQKLLKAFKNAELILEKTNVLSDDYDIKQQKAINIEVKLDDYCQEKSYPIPHVGLYDTTGGY